MLENSEMFESSGCFDPNSSTHHPQVLIDHQDVSNFHQISNFSAIEAPVDHLHHQHLMNMGMDYQQINWNHNHHDQILMGIIIIMIMIRFLWEWITWSFGKGRDNKDTKHFATEKHRRQQLNGKFEALKNLVPNPTKTDRASVVGDAIEYINELKRTVEELKILVDRKRCNRSRMKKRKTEDDSTLDVESIYTRSNGGGGGGGGDTGHDQQAYNGNSTSTMRSSWLQRKSKNTEIDVRIIDDEVTIKLVQQKRINCLLLVSKVLDELQLDLHHVAGGLIGDFYSYMFNTKICEGSSVYASAIANKLIEVVDKQYATNPVTSSY